MARLTITLTVDLHPLFQRDAVARVLEGLILQAVRNVVGIMDPRIVRLPEVGGHDG